MACCGSSKPEDAVSRALDKEMVETRKKQSREIKILLLGPGDSGKSTLAKQVQLLYKEGFSDAERLAMRPIIYSNIVFTLKELIKRAAAIDELELAADNKKRGKRIVDCHFVFPDDEPLGVDLGDDIKAMWADEAIRAAYARRAEFNILDSAAYFFERINEVKRDDYVPSDADILHARKRTRGIIETTYVVEKTSFRLVDVGGQRNERSKWIHAFEDVSAIIYCASISEFNQALEEDPNVNRMHESLRLFEGICGYKWFVETPIILFLNKMDLFATNIARHELAHCFPEYQKPASDVEQHAANFIKAKFEAAAQRSTPRQLHTHFTQATDTQQTHFIFEVVRKTLLQTSLKNAYA